MAITVTALDLGTVDLPGWHPRAADKTCLTTAQASIERLTGFDPDAVHLSHDRTILRRQP
jgi:hypothetical protein